jgi:hypothetical protein
MRGRNSGALVNQKFKVEVNIMSTKTDVIIFITGGIDAVNSLTTGSASGGPTGAAGQVISTAGAGGQVIGTISGVTPIVTAAVVVGLAGNVLTAVQVSIDVVDGQTVKAGDVLAIATGIPVAVAVGVGLIGAGSVLIPVAAIAAFSGAALNIGGVTSDDVFNFFDKFVKKFESSDSSFTPWDLNLYRVPGMPSVVDPICNRDYTAARGWTFPRDPLVLDLDGDGIETLGIDPLAPILFDHDADGVKTGTGWIQSDDGLLVIDVNGTATNTNLGNGNTQVASGSFTRTNGSTGQSGSAQLTGSYLLAGNGRRYVFSSCLRHISWGFRPEIHKSNCVRAKKYAV